MPRCLNPKKTHENRGSFVHALPSEAIVAHAEPAVVRLDNDEQVTCRFCKYLLEDAVLGDSRVIRWIGSGTFGDVYEAEQLPPLSRRVAIKVMSLERAVDGGQSAEMFAREVTTIAALDHPNILPVLHVGMIDDGRPYLVMKYAARGSLQQFCQSAAPFLSLIPTVVQPATLRTPTAELTLMANTILKISEEDEDKTDSRLQLTAHTPTAEEEATSHTESDEAAEQTLRRTLPDPMALELLAPSDHSATDSLEPSHPSATPLASEDEVADVSADEAAEQALRRTLPDPMALELLAPSDHSPSDSLEPSHPSATPLASEDEVADVSADEDEVPADDPPRSASATHLPTPFASEDSVGVGVEVEVEIEIESTLILPQRSETLLQQQASSQLRIETAAITLNDEGNENEPEQTPAHDLEQIATILLAEQDPALAEQSTLIFAQPARRSSVLSPQEVLPFIEEASAALQYAHDHGLIHLDIKPANLLLDAHGRLMLADFGVSVLLEGYTHASLHCYVGTPLYTAPEQWLEQPRAASDQYALATTCYQLLAGRAPFTGNLYAVMHGHLQALPPLMNEFNPTIPDAIEKVIQRALAKDPVERYPSMLAFAQAYREALEQGVTQVSLSVPTDTPPGNDLVEQLSPGTLPLLLVDMEKTLKIADPQHQVRQLAGKTSGRIIEKHLLPEVEETGIHPYSAPVQSHWVRNLLLCTLALLLITSGSLGLMRVERPCWLGVCARMLLSTNHVNITNSASQIIKITNTGTDTLNWQAVVITKWSTPWLSLTESSSSLAPGKAGQLTITTSTDAINNSEVIYDTIEITGGQGVAPQIITVTETIVKGLAAISVKAPNTSFLYEQGHLQPGTQRVTITNKSGHTLNWFAETTDNNWLQVTPGQGKLANNATVDLSIAVTNPQNLATDQYQVTFSLVGQLDNQQTPSLMQTINFTLRVNQPAVTPTTIPPPLPSPTTQASLSFSAQPVAANGAPGQQRSAHSMVWDTQNNQLLVFGGIDSQGNLLNDLWSYKPASNQWTNLTPLDASASGCDSIPSPRMNAALIWDSLHNQLLLYGGQGAGSSYLDDLWSYTPTSRIWANLECSASGPGARAGAGVAWNGGSMLILGGLNSAGLLTDFWSYTPGSSDGWQQLASTTPLGARAYPTMSWDTTDKQLYVFGGLQASGQQSGDFYVYQPGAGWNSVNAGNGARPTPRQQAMSIWDSTDRVFLLLGGWGTSSDTSHGALWAYSPAKNAWGKILSLQSSSVTSIVPSRSASAMVWDSSGHYAYLYAGAGSENKAALEDLWMIVPG